MSSRCECCGARWSPEVPWTRRQKEVFEWIRAFIEEHGHAPSYKEIAEGIGVASLSSVHDHVVALEELGVLRRTGGPNKEAAIELLVDADLERRDPEELIGWGPDPT